MSIISRANYFDYILEISRKAKINMESFFLSNIIFEKTSLRERPGYNVDIYLSGTVSMYIAAKYL
jgi:hypothetical protein